VHGLHFCQQACKYLFVLCLFCATMIKLTAAVLNPLQSNHFWHIVTCMAWISNAASNPTIWHRFSSLRCDKTWRIKTIHYMEIKPEQVTLISVHSLHIHE
jgi:hypothetical protein